MCVPYIPAGGALPICATDQFEYEDLSKLWADVLQVGACYLAHGYTGTRVVYVSSCAVQQQCMRDRWQWLIAVNRDSRHDHPRWCHIQAGAYSA